MVSKIRIFQDMGQFGLKYIADVNSEPTDENTIRNLSRHYFPNWKTCALDVTQDESGTWNAVFNHRLIPTMEDMENAIIKHTGCDRSTARRVASEIVHMHQLQILK